VKAKCVHNRAALVKASRNVVDFVGNMEMPRWGDENKEPVGAYAIALRHKLGHYMQHRVEQQWSTRSHQCNTSGTKSPPQPSKDLNAERLEYPEETLTPEERRSNIQQSNILEVDETAGMAAEIDEISKNTADDGPSGDESANDGPSGDESEAEPMDVEDDAVYAKRHDEDMETNGPDKGESEKMANADWEHWENQQNRRRIEKTSCGTRPKHMRRPSDQIT
jgi:hypothetical protein